MCHMSHVQCHHFLIFSLESGGASQWRVWYQWDLHSLVSLRILVLKGFWDILVILHSSMKNMGKWAERELIIMLAMYPFFVYCLQRWSIKVTEVWWIWVGLVITGKRPSENIDSRKVFVSLCWAKFKRLQLLTRNKLQNLIFFYM